MIYVVISMHTCYTMFCKFIEFLVMTIVWHIVFIFLVVCKYSCAANPCVDFTLFLNGRICCSPSFTSISHVFSWTQNASSVKLLSLKGSISMTQKPDCMFAGVTELG